jgi:hypothetical protein
MSISFSDAQLKTVSKVILDTPQEVAQAIANKDFAIIGKADALKKDDANAVFYDNSVGIIDQYQKELRAINGSQRTLYPDSALQTGGALAAGNPHFTEDWVKFNPKLIDSMNGLPITSESDHENFRRPRLSDAISKLKTGWTGSANTTLNAAYNGGTTINIVAASSFAVGDLVIVQGASNSALAIVNSIDTVPASPGPPPVSASTNLIVTVLASPSASIPTGATVRNFFGGFTNVQRESWSVGGLNEVFTYYRNLITTEKNFLKSFLDNQKTALASNGAVGAEATERNTATANVQAALDSIATWEGLADTGAGSKYGDTGILNLETVITNRNTQAPARATSIVTFLGSVSQNPDGTFTGTNNYSTLATWIDLRINKSAGSLRVFYDFDQIIAFIEQTVQMALKKKNEYDQYMIVKRIVSNPNDTAVVGLENVTDLSVGNAIQVLDDSALPVINANILNIVGNIVTLSQIVPSTYTTQNAVRLIKSLS